MFMSYDQIEVPDDGEKITVDEETGELSENSYWTTVQQLPVKSGAVFQHITHSSVQTA